jgi:uncharacterized protein (DUF433 family)
MNDRIVSSAETLSGKPRIAGTRIAVEMILEDLGSGMTPAQIVECYPSLTAEDVQAAVEYTLMLLRTKTIAAE